MTVIKIAQYIIVYIIPWISAEYIELDSSVDQNQQGDSDCDCSGWTNHSWCRWAWIRTADGGFDWHLSTGTTLVQKSSFALSMLLELSPTGSVCMSPPIADVKLLVVESLRVNYPNQE